MFQVYYALMRKTKVCHRGTNMVGKGDQIHYLDEGKCTKEKAGKVKRVAGGATLDG